MLESAIERKFEEKVSKQLDALVWKFVSPGTAGVPDRLVILPGGRTIYVELKRPGEDLRKLQVYRKKQLEQRGHTCVKVDNMFEIDLFIQGVKQGAI